MWLPLAALFFGRQHIANEITARKNEFVVLWHEIYGTNRGILLAYPSKILAEGLCGSHSVPCERYGQ